MGRDAKQNFSILMQRAFCHAPSPHAQHTSPLRTQPIARHHIYFFAENKMTLLIGISYIGMDELWWLYETLEMHMYRHGIYILRMCEDFKMVIIDFHRSPQCLIGQPHDGIALCRNFSLYIDNRGFSHEFISHVPASSIFCFPSKHDDEVVMREIIFDI